MNNKLEESNNKKRRNALAEKILLAMINNGIFFEVKSSSYDYAIKHAYKIADEFIEYPNK